MTPERLAEIEARASKATQAPLEVGIFDPELDPIDLVRRHLSYGAGAIYNVWAPEHRDTRIGTDRSRPEHVAIAAITGNGPTSEANAEFFAA